jgi:hypothetical protein
MCFKVFLNLKFFLVSTQGFFTKQTNKNNEFFSCFFSSQMTTRNLWPDLYGIAKLLFWNFPTKAKTKAKTKNFYSECYVSHLLRPLVVVHLVSGNIC